MRLCCVRLGATSVQPRMGHDRVWRALVGLSMTMYPASARPRILHSPLKCPPPLFTQPEALSIIMDRLFAAIQFREEEDQQAAASGSERDEVVAVSCADFLVITGNRI